MLNSWNDIFDQIKEALGDYENTYFDEEKIRQKDPGLKLPNFFQFGAMVFQVNTIISVCTNKVEFIFIFFYLVGFSFPS